MEDCNEFERILKAAGFKEVSSGKFSNGEFEFVYYGIYDYKVNCYKIKQQKSIRNGKLIATSTPCPLEEIFDDLPDVLKEWCVYNFDSFPALLPRTGLSWSVTEKIGIGVMNPKGISKMNITN